MPSGAQMSLPRTSKQFLRVDDRGGRNELHLDEKVVGSYLLSDDVADKPVLVISVAGEFRTGKSFLLNSLTRYLKASDKSRWFDYKSESFPWKSGCEAHTDGMTMSQPIPIKLQSGEEAVLLLLDTQGLFADSSKKAVSIKIFALSLLLSSIQVFNLTKNLTSDALEYLQFFAEYGRLFLDNTEGKPFQDLVFLIRDWYYTNDHAIGSQGGNELVEKRLRSNSGSDSQQGNHIKACFTDVSGFLLPFPGEAVASNPTFDGDVKDMEREFTDALEHLMSTLLSPERLPLKMIGNHPMTCRDLADLIGKYTDLFRSDELPEPKSILQATAEVGNMAAVYEELKAYTNQMQGLLREDAPMLTEQLLGETHEQAKEDALKSFAQQIIIRDPSKPEDHYSRLLANEIEDWFRETRHLFADKCERDFQKAEKNKRYQRNAKIAKSLTVAAAVVGLVGAVAAGPAAVGVFMAVGELEAAVAAGGLVFAIGSGSKMGLKQLSKMFRTGEA